MKQAISLPKYSKNQSPSQDFLAGLQAAIPVMLGYIPVGFAYGILARQAGFTALETVLMSLTVYAGAAQMLTTSLFAQGTAFAAIVIAIAILNLRHFIMSAVVFRNMDKSSLPLRLLNAHFVTDECFSVYTTGFGVRKSGQYFLGLGLASYLAWAVSSLLGALSTAGFPPILSLSLGISLYAMFIALLMPSIRKNARLGLLVLATALLNLALVQVMDSSWALILSTLLGAGAGVFFVEEL